MLIHPPPSAGVPATLEGGKEGGREEGREGGRERGREEERERGREGGRTKKKGVSSRKADDDI